MKPYSADFDLKSWLFPLNNANDLPDVLVLGFQDITQGMFSSNSDAAALWNTLIFKCVNKYAPEAQF
jgi:hypothetical protein